MTEVDSEQRDEKLRNMAASILRESIEKKIFLEVVDRKKPGGFTDEPYEIEIDYHNMNLTDFDSHSNLDRWKEKFSEKIRECETKLIPMVVRYNKLEAAIDVLQEGWNDCLTSEQIGRLKKVLDK